MENPSSSSSSSSSSPSPPPSSSSSSSSDDDENLLSIQKEPRALFEKDLKLAREAALEVINNNSEEEALKIFLQGLEPVITSVRPIWDDVLTSDSDDDDYDEEDEEYY